MRFFVDCPRALHAEAETRHPEPIERDDPSGQQQFASTELGPVCANSPVTALNRGVEPGIQPELLKSAAVRKG
jgi:hypothetical protein